MMIHGDTLEAKGYLLSSPGIPDNNIDGRCIDGQTTDGGTCRGTIVGGARADTYFAGMNGLPT